MCGNEFNSVLAEEDSASFKSSEVTVTQIIQEDLNDEGDTKSEETVENVIHHERKNSFSKSLNEEDAAVIIQLAYRSFKVSLLNTNYFNFFIHININLRNCLHESNKSI